MPGGRLPLRRLSASVPAVGFASVAVTELHPLDGVRHGRDLVLLLLLLLDRLLERTHNAISAWRGRARVRGQFRPGASTNIRTFLGTGKSAKNLWKSFIRRTRR